jgi:acetyltransferase-like isoleucine patch superfamily enzyme
MNLMQLYKFFVTVRIFKKVRTLFHFLSQPLITVLLRGAGVVVGRNQTFYGFPEISQHPASEIRMGDRIVLCSDSKYTALAVDHPVKISTIRANALISMGNDVGMSGTCIVCANEIIIGSEVMMGANVVVVDTDFHPLKPENRRYSDDVEYIGTAPVYIGNNVFIGASAIILKGVHIGDDCVVAAGAIVVAGEYAKGSILAGNPARVVGNVYQK